MKIRTNQLVCQICNHVKKLTKALPQTAHKGILQQLEDQMDCLLKKRKVRESEEMAYAILLMIDSFSKKTMKGSEGER